MANDGNVVLSPGGAVAAGLTSRASNVLGPASLPLVFTGNVDDANLQVTLPFSVMFNGVSYTDVYVSSNSYLTFGAGSSGSFGLGPGTPAIPGILINASDRSYQRVYAGAENGGATFRIRYEGSNGVSGTNGAPQIVWEITFTAASPASFLIDVGVSPSTGVGESGVSSGVGPTYLASFSAAGGNVGFNLTFSAGGSGYPMIDATMTQSTPITQWRLFITANEPGQSLGINEIQFRSAAGVAQLFSGGTASASSALRPASYASDNNDTTSWEVSTYPGPWFWQYTYGSAMPTVAEYTIFVDKAYTYPPVDFSLQYYNPSTAAWVTTDTRSGVVWGTNDTKTFTVGAPANTGNVVFTAPSVAGTLSGPVVNAGDVTMPFPTLAAGGGPSGIFGGVVMPFIDVTGLFVMPTTQIDGDANIGNLGGTPWQIYAAMVSAPVPNSSYGNIVLFDEFTGAVISVNATDYPPLVMPLYSVGATGFAGIASDGDISYNFDVSAVGLVGNVGDSSADFRIPLFSVDAGTGLIGDIALLPYDMVATANVGAITSGAALLEPYDAAGTMFSSTSSSGDITMPVFVVTAGVTSANVINGAATMPAASVKGNMLSGQSIAGVIQVPLLSVSARGYSSTIGNASIKIPALSVAGTMISIPSALTAADFKTIVLNSRTHAVSTYEGLAANSLCQFNGMVLAATANGIVALTGEKDGAADIDAFIRSSVSQYGTQFFKRVINGYIGYRADGKLKVTLYTDETHEHSYPLAPRQTATIHPSKVKFGRGVEGRYWQWKIANTAGADFEIDAYEMDVDVLTRRI